ncbi:MAG: DUF2922 domain-containing protein [Liquorilactobacillus nagelii]|jgi:hypothetical protein|uniref:DUF2922 domain-containing protein n=1 Tax=Liquorilactobacillus nagelii TaxID=82688 RepID=A0A3S6QVG1_9LACO|nr:DUF2922 domain-containing protein [Liquorilactobacillus nagelii]AUJ32064.1 hypothetical protein BSQ50_05535 [Liquorilactobacillus nagelii]KRL41042.1 hypothetical protein FD45_GL001698 [Liquorilactobacillus nagelii DSM 13675]MCC7615219.1 DUF2922 domain-containing protein [Liquorilactobacillus nagelii]MCI1632633.1 DUF2922 domain-containing protein [Liquorilactobacillus nagelii]MCI1920749.1 DUF2922 domain-containing protein [Liquorilactobacillus nagelii]
MKQLDLVFTDETGKNKTHFRLDGAKETLSAETVRDTMQKLISLEIFVAKKGQKMFVTPVEAKYIETLETPIFTL